MDHIGIDIGRVLTGPTVDGVADTSFLGTTVAEAMHSPPATGAFAFIEELVRRYDGRVWLVSKCGASVERKTRIWLEFQRFHETTGVPRSHLRFCRERHQKADHARELGLTHFIDDRVDVLRHLRGLVPHLLRFGEDGDPCPAWAVPVRDWNEVSEWFDSNAAPQIEVARH